MKATPRSTRPAALAAVLVAAACVLAVLGLAAGSEGWSFAWGSEWDLVAAIRAPRTCLYAAWVSGL